MKSPFNKLYLDTLSLLFQSIARFCIRHSIKFRQFVAIAKEAFITAARDELARTGAKESISKLCIMTGLQRIDIGAIISTDDHLEKIENNLMIKLISQWTQDKRFLNAAGKPKPLSTDTKDCDFVKLLHLFHTDLNHHTVLFELERLGVIERKDNTVVLKSSFFQPKGDAKRGYELLAADVSDLINAVEENIKVSQPVNLHAKTEYDNIPVENIEEIKTWLLKEGTAFHERVREYISQYDRDYQSAKKKKNSKEEAEGRARIGIGTFTFSEIIDGGEDE